MKRLEGYTKRELAELTRQQIIDLVDLECAFEGVPLKDFEVLAEVRKPEPDTLVFMIDDYFGVTNKEDAEKIVEFLSGFDLFQTTYVGGSHYEKKLKKVNASKISAHMVFTQEHWDLAFPEYEQYSERKKLVDDQKKEYEKYTSVRAQITNKVKGAVDEAVKYVTNINNLVAQFERYLKLAEGDVVTARKFLLDSNPNVREKYPDFYTWMMGLKIGSTITPMDIC